MRSIGHLQDESQARRFSDFLYSQGIESQVEGPPSPKATAGGSEPETPGRWEIWVVDDENVERAGQMLEQFVRNPDDPRFAKVARVAARRRQQDHKARVGKRTRTIDGRMILYSPPVSMGILTIILIVISVAVTLLTDFGRRGPLAHALRISQYSYSGEGYGPPPLPEIRHGQIWRLFTPMFLHFGLLHIFFNMLWLRDLGSMVEARKSPWMLLLLVLVIAGVSNVAQYFVSGPGFGGMSGVVYGLLGYIWMQGRFNPASRLSLEPQTVTFMIVWFFVCLFGLVGNIANTVHAVGLILGIVWGFLAARLATGLRRG
jgi:GlpG protein